MPKRQPEQGETKSQWMDYCMGDSEMVEEYKDEGQRYAVCESYWTRAQKSAGLEAAATCDNAIRKALSDLSPDELVGELKNVLSKTWDQQARTGVIAAIRAVENLEGSVTADEIDLIDGELSRHLGQGLEEAIREPVAEIQEAAYLSGGAVAAGEVGAAFAFNLPDKKSLAVLHENTLFWVGDYYGDDLQEGIRESLQRLFEGGGQRSEVMWDLRELLEESLGGTESYWDLLADHTATKIQEIGRVSGYEQAGLMAVRIRARIDDRTSEICRRLHGHIIAVENLRGQVDGYLQACETQNKDKIKKSWPWWSDKKAKRALRSVRAINRQIARGKIGLPPYHARCRTITVAEMQLRPGSHEVPEKEQQLFGEDGPPLGNEER